MSATAPPCTIVIFGGAGDLTLRLLMPAIYDLSGSGLLDPGTTIVGADHNDRDDDAWRGELKDAMQTYAREKGTDFDANAWSFVSERLAYAKFDFTNDADYDAFAKRFGDAANVLFYFAVSPRFFESIAKGLARTGLLTERDGSFRRIAVEKPFGRDAASARELNALLTSVAAEPQIFRVDHFLGKEAVQGIFVLRFANRAFEPLLHRDTIASVQITAAETVGVEERGGFYETAGALRDMVPNHLFSLLTLIAMDEPKTFDDEAVRDAKARLLDVMRPLGPADAARGQYGAGSEAGKSVRAYRDEDNVARDSRTETYAALRAFVDNDRWRDVPFYIRTGKRMAAHVTTIALELRPPSGKLGVGDTLPHLMLLGIDPERGLVQRFAAKRPGVDLDVGRADAGFRYETTFTEPPNTGYETLLYHIMIGNQTLFQRDDMIEREWELVDGVLDAWNDDPKPPEPYAAGSAGPSGADALLARDGNRWLDVAPLGSLGASAG